MRLVCYALANGENEIYATSDDGLRILKVFEGHPQTRPKQEKKITAFLEVIYANNDIGYKQAKEVLGKLQNLLPAPDAQPVK